MIELKRTDLLLWHARTPGSTSHGLWARTCQAAYSGHSRDKNYGPSTCLSSLSGRNRVYLTKDDVMVQLRLCDDPSSILPVLHNAQSWTCVMSNKLGKERSAHCFQWQHSMWTTSELVGLSV